MLYRDGSSACGYAAGEVSGDRWVRPRNVDDYGKVLLPYRRRGCVAPSCHMPPKVFNLVFG
jgi:hypothetical protein